jgi:hypothetical protein
MKETVVTAEKGDMHLLAEDVRVLHVSCICAQHWNVDK